MLVNADYKAMEWETAIFLSQDPVGMYELNERIDQHGDNQSRLGLPSRLVAKIFLFRLIFGGSAYSYATDPDFTDVSRDQRFWQRGIDAFYDKYKGLATWHTEIVRTVMEQGKLILPTGRMFAYHPSLIRGSMEWPRTIILNYPVQGLGADLMVLVRTELRRLLRESGLEALIISSVHDSVLLDCPSEEVEIVVDILKKVWYNIPVVFEKKFGVKYNLQPRCEIQVGPNWGDMKDVD